MTKITLYQAFQTEYPYITISEENFKKAYQEAKTSNLDHLKDYILAKGLEEEVELWTKDTEYHHTDPYITFQNGYHLIILKLEDSGNRSLLSTSEKAMPYAMQNETTSH